MNLTRRRYLAGLCISLSGVSGCSALEQDTRAEVTIPQLSIENKDDSEHHVEILLLHDDEPVFVKSVTADAATYDGNDLKATGGQVWQDVAPSEQAYTLHARIDGGEWFTTRFEEWGSGCVRVEVQISKEGEGLFAYLACE